MEIETLPATRPNVERIRFNGIVYRRYPQAKGLSDRNYFRCGLGDKARGFGMLHRDVWRYHHGPIPDGWEIHHRDLNPLNNAVDNLEALPPLAHREHHMPDSRQRTAIAYKSSTAYRERQLREAARWHQSDEGRRWHSEHARQMHEDAPLVEKRCECCGGAYQVNFLTKGTARFCSDRCKAKWRRDAGVDNESRTCASCHTPFVCNHYSKLRYCSRACASAARQKREERSCPHCHTTFVVRPSEQQRYCCLACAYADRRT